MGNNIGKWKIETKRKEGTKRPTKKTPARSNGLKRVTVHGQRLRSDHSKTQINGRDQNLMSDVTQKDVGE